VATLDAGRRMLNAKAATPWGIAALKLKNATMGFSF
jgi:hypothetical protein